MNRFPDYSVNTQWIVSKRGKKNIVDPHRPYAWLVEKERTASGKVEDTAIIFLTNRECLYQCLMCDLWKNTTHDPVPIGAIPEQIEWALKQFSGVKHLKLYNSGSFFDTKAIPEADYKAIAQLANGFETVIVESHPRLINEKCLQFRDMLKPQLHVALGLETAHPDILRKLNKRMTLEGFEQTVRFLSRHSILSRAFILLKPPFLTEPEGVFWAKRTIDFAFSVGVECCTVIPVRAGNGAMESLMKEGFFSPPDLGSLEEVLEYGISLKSGRIFADTWDLSLFSGCDKCLEPRTNRLISMNLNQTIMKREMCLCNNHASTSLNVTNSAQNDLIKSVR